MPTVGLVVGKMGWGGGVGLGEEKKRETKKGGRWREEKKDEEILFLPSLLLVDIFCLF